MRHLWLSEDETKLRLALDGRQPLPFKSKLTLSAVLAFLLVYFIVASQMVRWDLPEGWYLRTDWLWRLGMATVLLSVPALIALFVAWITAVGVDRYWQTLEWDHGNGVFWGDQPCHLGRRQSHQVQLRDVREYVATFGPERDEPITIDLEFHCTGHADLKIENLTIQDVEQREEALDVLSNIARVTGLTHYAVDENRPERMVVRFGKQLQGSPKKVMPIPQRVRPARYDFNQLATELPLERPQVAAFDPDDFCSTCWSTIRWKPGRLVRLERPATTFSAAISAGCAVGLTAAVAIGLLMLPSGDFDLAVRLAIPLLAAAIVTPIAALVVFLRYRNCHVTIDWQTQQISWSRGWITRRAKLADANDLLLRGLYRRTKRKDESVEVRYLCRLELRLTDGRRVFLLENNAWRNSEEESRREMEPFAGAMANALGLPWRWLSYQPGITSRVSEWSVALALSMGAAGLVGFFAGGFVYQSFQGGRFEDLVQELGAERISLKQGAIRAGGQPVFGHGWLISVHDPTFDDAGLQRLLERIREDRPLLALDLSSTSVTDRGIRELILDNNVFLLSLRNTRVTSSSMDAIANSNVCYLDVRDTPIRLDALSMFHNAYRMEHLLVSDPDVVDGELHMLDMVPRLATVLINDQATTERILQLTRRRGSARPELGIAAPYALVPATH